MSKYTAGQRVEAFWSMVNKDGPVHPGIGTACWEWTGARTKFRNGSPGYGVVAGGKGDERLAHRRAWAMAFGAPDMCVLHRCDNPGCVRVDHLFLGTYLDNNRDMSAKGRHGRQGHPEQAQGERNGFAKLTDTTAASIPKRHAEGETQKGIAASLGVSQSTVSLVLLGRRWQHVTGIAVSR